MLPREGLSVVIWKRMDDGSFIYVTTPADHLGKPGRTDRVRIQVLTALRLSETAASFCRLVLVNYFDMGGSVPKSIVNFYLRLTMTVTSRMQRHFHELRKLGNYDGVDGKALAITLLYGKRTKNASGKMRRQHEMVGEVVKIGRAHVRTPVTA